MVLAGFAAVDITPPLGSEIPGLFHKRFATGIHDPLYARAVVLADGRTMVALVQVDTLFVPDRIAADARAQAEALCGIRGANCLIAATHTHSGGASIGVFLSESDPRYEAALASGIASAIAEAHRRLEPAELGVGAVDAPGIAFNRRFRMQDGTQATHPGKNHPGIVEPAGPASPAVTAIGVRTPGAAAPRGCIVHFACHATHMNGTEFSADYPKWIVDSLQSVYGPGFGVVFLNGACGDVTQIDNRSARPPECGPYWAERSGRTVGAVALQVLARMDYFTGATLGTEVAEVDAAIREPAPGTLDAARQRLKEENWAHGGIDTIYAHELVLVEERRQQQPAQVLEVQGVRIGTTAIWTVPVELFQAFEHDVRAESPFRHTLCASMANGYAGYVCTPEAFAGGGYEPRTARSSFLAEDTGGRLADAASRVMRALYEAAPAAERDGTGPIAWPKSDDTALDGLKRSQPLRKS